MKVGDILKLDSTDLRVKSAAGLLEKGADMHAEIVRLIREQSVASRAAWDLLDAVCPELAANRKDFVFEFDRSTCDLIATREFLPWEKRNEKEAGKTV